MAAALMSNLGNKLKVYFELMQNIRESCYRVVRISDRYLCITSFSVEQSSVQCSLVLKDSLMEQKLLAGLTGPELIAYGEIMQKIDLWAQTDRAGEFPISTDQDAYAEYRGLQEQMFVQADSAEANPTD